MMRGYGKYKPSELLGLLTATFLLGACAPTFSFKTDPRLQDKLPSIRTVAIMPREVTLYEDQVTGPKLMWAWSRAAQENLVQAIDAELSRDGRFVVTPLPDEADAQLVLTGGETFASPGKKAEVALAILTSPLWLQLALAFPRQGPAPSQVGDELHVKLVERAAGAVLCKVIQIDPAGNAFELGERPKGADLWSSHLHTLSGYDLRDRSSATALVQKMFKDFPRAGGAQ